MQARRHHFEKKTIHYREQDPAKIAAFLQELGEINPQRLVYVDETGIDTFLHRERARAPIGTKIYAEVSGKKYKRVGIVAALAEKSILAPLQYEGTMDSILFEHWFRICLLPELPRASVIIMDNAAFHRKRILHELAQADGHTVLFLPPYSPEYNPIENFWSWLKRQLRKFLHRFSSFDDALCACFKLV